MYKCRVCGKEFKNLLVHLRINGVELLKNEEIIELLCLSEYNMKRDHINEFRKVKNSLNMDSLEKCLCGGNIVSDLWYKNSNLFPINICEECGFVWEQL